MLHLDALERRFMAASAAMLVVFAVAILWSVASGHTSLPAPAGRIDPAEVRTTAPFDNPGLHQTGPGEYDAVFIASAWQWSPAEIRVPAGSKVRFLVTTVDVIHGFRIPSTNANAMVIPGQITKVTVEFDEPRRYSLICHEYCGIGHHQMGGTIVVE